MNKATEVRWCLPAGLKAWVSEGKEGAGRILLNPPVRPRPKPRRDHTSTASRALQTWKLYLLRNWKVHK
ncbi:unnamed protein product [Boreogadus saida]